MVYSPAIYNSQGITNLFDYLWSELGGSDVLQVPPHGTSLVFQCGMSDESCSLHEGPTGKPLKLVFSISGKVQNTS